MDSAHEGKSTFQCTHCGSSFSRKACLKKHLLKFHNETKLQLKCEKKLFNLLHTSVMSLYISFINIDQYPKSRSDHPDSGENVDMVTENNIKISTYNYVFLKSCTHVVVKIIKKILKIFTTFIELINAVSVGENKCLT